MATIVNEAEQIITMEATDDISRERMAVESIIVRGTAGGTYEVTFGNATIYFTTTAEVLTKQFMLNRSTNYIKLVSGPADATLYVLLEQKR